MQKKIYLFLTVAALGSQGLYGQNFWKKTRVNERNIIESKRNIGADYSNTYALDINLFKSALKAAPLSKAGQSTQSKVTIEIPLLNGKFEKYAIHETSNMAPELAAKFPDIKSYRGVSVNNPSQTISFGLSPNGIKLIMFDSDQRPVVIEPVTKDASVYLVSPAAPDVLAKTDEITCHIEDKNKTNNNFLKSNTDDRRLRTFRLAVSVDGEFSEYHGGTVAKSLAAINDLMSYINPVYERDLSIHMNLIANNNEIIYLDKTTDPYNASVFLGNFLGNTLNSQVQKTLTEVIGEANYDIGIVLSNQKGAEGGNAGKIAAVCVDGGAPIVPTPLFGYKIVLGKGAAYAGPVNGTGPQGFIYSMVIAHEMGHQYGANHTFSRSEASGAESYKEPGSGTTIMGYPGVTGTYDVADKHSNQFLHYSLNQINEYIRTTTCATTTNLSNNPPVVNAGSDYTIPKGTAFKLTAIASDPDNNNLTYSWEEADLSPSDTYSFPDRQSTTTPNFRVYPPSSSPTRYFPPLETVLNGSLYNTWNMVSDVTRDLKFVSLIRDNAVEGGQTASGKAKVSVNQNMGPFKITSISLNQNLPSGTSHLLKWDVAGTNTAPINTQSVNILISTDGGTTFTPLVSNTPNDGEESITIPSGSSKKAFIMVESVGNIYYAASPAFAIDYNITMNCTQYPGTGTFTIAPNAPATININVPVTTIIEDINIPMDLSYTDLKDIAMVIKSPNDTRNQIFWYSNCPGKNILKATFDQEGESSAMNCNNLNSNPAVRIEPIRLDLSKYYGQNPNGNWVIKAIDVTTGSTSSGKINNAGIELCTREAISTLGVKDYTFQKDEFQIYPNPSNGRFNVAMKKNSSTEVQIFDTSGRLVHSQTNITNDTKIDLTGFAKGNYIMIFNTGAKKIAKKVIIK